MTLRESDTAFLLEWNRREALEPLYVAGKYGCVRISASPIDPRQFHIKGIAESILRMETERKGKIFHGARYLTLTTACRELCRVARKMQRAEQRIDR